MKNLNLLIPALLLSVAAIAAETPSITPALERTPALAEWEAMKYGAFICFGMSTFTQEEYGKKPATPEDYNPTALDVDQWVRVIRDAGMKYALLTTKHCYGHCLWPSKFTENTVANSPVKTDVVRAYVDACRKHGIKPGLYYLIGWDQHHQKRMTPDQYEEFCINQLTELLTGYGPICEIWLDIPWDMGPGTPARLERVYAACRKSQPECLVLLNQSFHQGTAPHSKPESWLQEATGRGEVLIWPTDIMNGEETPPPSTGHVSGITVNGVKQYLPMETEDCLNRHWFWVKGDKPKPLSWLVARHRAVVGKNANWILDVTPDQEGKIPQEQIDALTALKRVIEDPSTYPAPLSVNAKTTASNCYRSDPRYGPASALDSASDTRWATDDGTTSAWLEVDLGKPQNIGRAVIEQAYPELKRIRKFAIEYKDGDAWKVCYHGEDPGSWLDVTFDPVNAQRLRLNISEASDGPTISEFQLYKPAAADDVLSIRDGRFHLDGKPFAEISFNKFDLLWQLYEQRVAGKTLDDANPLVQAQDKALRELHEMGFRTIRFFGLPWGPTGAESYADPKKRELLYEALDKALALCDKHQIRVVWCLAAAGFTDTKLLPDKGWVHGEEQSRELMSNPETRGRQLLYRYIDETVVRYKDRKAVLMWEIGNELTLLADIGEYNGERMPTLKDVAGFYRDVTKRIKAADPLRLVSSGGSHMRESQWNLCQGKGWTKDTFEEQFNCFDLLYTSTGVDVIDVHSYMNHKKGYVISDGKGGETLLGNKEWMKIARRLGKPLMIGELGLQAASKTDTKTWSETPDYFESYADTAAAKRWVEKALNSVIEAGVPLVYWWCYQSDRPMDQNHPQRLDLTRERNPELLDCVIQANRRLSSMAMSRAASVDRVLVGVNYFSGWWEPLPNKWHDPSDGSDWRTKYPGRVPLLGEYNTQATMDKEIEAAAAHGVDFFSILWYPLYGGVEPERNVRNVNAGLAQFLASPQAGQMKFMVEICNHPPFRITNDVEWASCIESLLPALKHPSYLRVGGKPVLKIHSSHHFYMDAGGDFEQQKSMLDRLRLAVRTAGLGEMFIGCGVTGGEAVGSDWPTAKLYDFTNTYMDVPKLEAKPEDYPYGELAKHIRQCNAKAASSVLPYVPFISAGWNPRPWKDSRPTFAFPTREQFAAELRHVVADSEKYPNFGLPLPDGGRQKMVTLYAWNEFGEGGIVAPTHGENYNKLEAIREVFPDNTQAANRNSPCQKK